MAQAAPVPQDEAERLRQLRALALLDTAPEGLFDTLARLASAVCQTPMALVSLVDEHRQWFKANVGLEGVQQTPRELAFCAHAILGSACMEVPDATLDARFADNALVTDKPRLRFYAGVPIAAPAGQRIGTLCVLDEQPRRLTAQQRLQLTDLAAVATHSLALRDQTLTLGLGGAQQARGGTERPRRSPEFGAGPFTRRRVGLEPRAPQRVRQPHSRSVERPNLRAIAGHQAGSAVRRGAGRQGPVARAPCTPWSRQLRDRPDGRRTRRSDAGLAAHASPDRARACRWPGDAGAGRHGRASGGPAERPAERRCWPQQ